MKEMDSSTCKFLALSTHFFSKLKNDGVHAVVKMLEKRNVNVLEKEMIAIPINDNNHWSLCVIVKPYNLRAELPRKIPFLLFFDSLPLSHYHDKNEIQSYVYKWLNNEKYKSAYRLNKRTMPMFQPSGACIVFT
jgi:Ulp1 family protease